PAPLVRRRRGPGEGNRLRVGVPGRASRLLTLRTKMRRPPAEHDSLDGGLARAAGLASAVVDLVAVLKAAGGAVGVHVVAQGAPAVADGGAQDPLDGAGEAFDLIEREVAGQQQRV